jgi:polyketide biosynthesis acyl carrier protein
MSMSAGTDMDAQILAAIRRNVTTVVPEIAAGDVVADRSLAELGCNSIDRAEIVTLTMEELGIDVPLSELRPGRDIGALIDLLRRHW